MWSAAPAEDRQPLRQPGRLAAAAVTVPRTWCAACLRRNARSAEMRQRHQIVVDRVRRQMSTMPASSAQFCSTPRTPVSRQLT